VQHTYPLPWLYQLRNFLENKDSSLGDAVERPKIREATYSQPPVSRYSPEQIEWASRKNSLIGAYSLCFKNKEWMKLLKFGLFSQNFFRNIKLPCQSIWVPFRTECTKTTWFRSDIPRERHRGWYFLPFKFYITQCGNMYVTNGSVEGIGRSVCGKLCHQQVNITYTHCRLPDTRNVVGRWLRIVSRNACHSSSGMRFCAL